MSHDHHESSDSESPPVLDPDHPDYYRVPGDYDDADDAFFDDEEATSDEWEWPEYIGETKRRSPWVATALTLVCPGLGYAYVGRFVTALLVNTIFPLAVFALLVTWLLQKFFPLMPLAVVAVGWFVLTGLILWDVLGIVARAKPYVVKSSNHPLVYGSLFVFSFALPIYGLVHWSTEVVWQRTWAASESMYPTIPRGDMLLVDRTAFLTARPARGDVVLVEEPASEDVATVYFARVIGVGSDRVHMEGTRPWVNGKQLEQRARGPIESLDEHPPITDGDPSRMWVHIEAPYGIDFPESLEDEPERWYLVTKPTRPILEPLKPVELGDEQLFVLPDNRTVPFGRDDEHIGGRVIERDWVVGRPIFVLYSESPDDGVSRWDRTGLRPR